MHDRALPLFLNVKGEIKHNMKKDIFSSCTLCPRQCGVNRYETVGFCGAPAQIKAAKACLHLWEEPCISGTNGSGAVFFSHCQLQCPFCQNEEISHLGKGILITPQRLCEIFLHLQASGAHNINLVSATPYVPLVIKALKLAKPQLQVPVLFNCGGYESVQTIQMLAGYVDIYMPDIKYYAPALTAKYFSAADYFEKALAALKEMYRQTGAPKQQDGLLKSGVIVRHLVMPGTYRDSIEILRQLHDIFGEKAFLLSLMSQYLPCGRAKGISPINSKITTFEYQKVCDAASALGFDGYLQERDSASDRYIPHFDFEGIL